MLKDQTLKKTRTLLFPEEEVPNNSIPKIETGSLQQLEGMPTLTA